MELQIQGEHFHSSVAITLIAVSRGISLAAILALKPDNIMYPPVSTILV